MVEVKICGLSNTETLDAALDAGADYVGFVFYGPSPRNIDYAKARELAKQTGSRAKKVALTVNADDQKIDEICDALQPDFIQAHGSETPERIAHIRDRTGVPVIKAIKVKDITDINSASGYQGSAEMILFDAKAPESLEGALPGGNGITFDWSLLGDEQAQPRFMLSGGLDADNLREAVRITNAPIADVSSGVETSPGVKNVDLIKAFVSAVKTL